jgi:DNA-binding MarR family transcriptional regulator
MAEVSDAIADSGLTTLQYGALLYLAKQRDPRGVEQNKLAAGMDVDRNSASLLVEQLVTRELVERHVNGDDRRVRLLRLSPKGKKLVARLEPAHLAANERILSPLTEKERELLFSLIIRVVEGRSASAASGTRRRKQSSR